MQSLTLGHFRCVLRALAIITLSLAGCSSADPERRGVVGRFAPPSSAGTAAVGVSAGSPSGPALDAATAQSVPFTPQSNAVDRSAQTPAMLPRVHERMVIDACPGPLSAEQLQALRAPEPQSGTTRWLYPYQQTVFPRGTAAPVLQWDSSVAQSVYLHAYSKQLDYQGCFAGGAAPNFGMPQDAWDLAGEQSNGPNDPLTIELTLATSSQVVRLPPLSLTFALANLKSAIYYNTYNSTIASAQGIKAGVVMRTLPRASTPEVFLAAANQDGDCVGCHAVSADGSRMVAATSNSPSMGLIGDFGTVEGPGASYDLTAVGVGTRPPPLQSNLKRTGLAALYPDGTRYLSQGAIDQGPTPTATGIPYPANVWGTFGPETSKLFDTNTGAEIPDSGAAEYAYMPHFSMDGSMLVFNNMDQSGSAGHTLAVMDFDRSQDKFSNLREVYRETTNFPAWPFFLPDVVDNTSATTSARGKRIVFASGTTPDFATQDVYLIGQFPHPTDLWWMDVTSGQAALLARANGQDTSGETYLPYADRDAHKNYYPTVSPVAAGGYFWMFFTSKRNYGNLFVRQTGEDYPEAKKIWVSAIDIDAPPGTDPSHPAFFLPGQELESGNIRAFASLEVCRPDGASCDVGIDCCCGYCTVGVCACNAMMMCANLDEKCTTAYDCCDEALACIGGFCEMLRAPD